MIAITKAKLTPEDRARVEKFILELEKMARASSRFHDSLIHEMVLKFRLDIANASGILL